MKKICSLNDNYTTVNGSFGGSQTYFRELPGLLNKGRNKGGCGIVALTDVILYLKRNTQIASKDEYRSLFIRNSLLTLWIPTRLGLSFLGQTFGFRILSLIERLPYHCFWAVSKKKLLPRVRKMLLNNIPVPLCIPNTLFSKNRNDKLKFYNSDKKVIDSVNGHFVVVTGLYEDDITHRYFFEISSWGQKYYISYEEYMLFLKSHFWGVVGGMIYIWK